MAPHAIYDEDEQRWISDAEVAETVLTAFTGRRRRDHVTARLIVRRVRRLNPTTVPKGQTEAFAVYRYQLSRPGARCRCCRRSVSPGRSPNPPCGSLRSGLSTVSAVRHGEAESRDWGSLCRGIGSA